MPRGLAAITGAWPALLVGTRIAGNPRLWRVRVSHRLLGLWLAVSVLPLGAVALTTFTRVADLDLGAHPVLGRLVSVIGLTGPLPRAIAADLRRSLATLWRNGTGLERWGIAGSGIVMCALGLGALAPPTEIDTLGYLLSGSAVAPIVSHVLMHLAAVLHGAGTTVQLPPHF